MRLEAVPPSGLPGGPELRLAGRRRLALADAASLARRTSPAVVRRKAARRVRGAVRSEVEVIELVKELDELRPLTHPVQLTILPITRQTLPALHELNRRRSASRKTHRFLGDLQRGCCGYVALRGGRAVAYYWWAGPRAAAGHRDLRRIDGSRRIGPGDVYGYDLYVADEARGGRTAVELLDHVEHALRALGHDRIWGYVEADNRPARWLYASRGYRPVRRLTTRTVLGYRSTQAAPA